MNDFKFKKLPVSDLQLSDTGIFMYYKEHYNFVYCSHKEGKFKNIPILKGTSEYMEANNINTLPFDYIEGFIKEYEKPIQFGNIQIGLEWVLKYVQPDPVYFHKDWFELGMYTAESFKAWELIINRLPEFEQYFSGEQLKGFAAFLIHEKDQELAERLAPYIKDGKGKHVALCLTALKNLNLINYTQAQNVYDSIGLNKSQCVGANDFLGHPEKLKGTDIQSHVSRIQSIIDSL